MIEFTETEKKVIISALEGSLAGIELLLKAGFAPPYSHELRDTYLDILEKLDADD